MIQWLCSKDGLEPVFKDTVETLLKGSGFDWRVYSGYRSMDEQQKLYSRFLMGGALAAPPGKSAHNFGLAIDVQLWEDGVMNWNVKSAGWAWLFKAVLANPLLHSGVLFGDFDHIERVNWRAYENWATS